MATLLGGGLNALPAQVTSRADTVAMEILRLRDSVSTTTKSLKVGLSLGFRYITDINDVNTRDVSISPVDTTLLVDRRDPGDLVVSGVLVAFPWRRKWKQRIDGRDTTQVVVCGFACHLGFVANVSLAALGPDNAGVFNKSLEGGIGLAYRLGNAFGVAFTVERVFSRRLRQPELAGQVIRVNGEALTSIDTENDGFFIDDNLTAVSLKFLYFF